MAIWEWVLGAYARPGVPEATLKLQDAHGQNTSFLLWAAWSHPDEATLKQGRQIARDWDRAVTGPLRSVRRELKGSTSHEELREDIKAAELKAERALLEALEPLAKRRKGDVFDIDNLRFDVLRADARQVHVLLVEKLPEPTTEEIS